MSIVFPSRTSLYVSTLSKESGMFPTVAPASAAWPTANKIFYYPIGIPSACTIYKLWSYNGTTAGGTDHRRLALYDSSGADGGPGSRLVLGSSLAVSGVSALLYDDITDVPIGPGVYWLGVWQDGTTDHIFRVNERGFGYYGEAIGAGGPPATATPVAPAANWIAVAGFTTRATP